MKLQKLTGAGYVPEGEAIELSDELLWVDEFSWSKVASNDSEYTIAGALIVEQSEKLAGRPITLERPDDKTGWAKRGIVKTLHEWANLKGQRFRLTFERGGSRSFTVMFKTSQPLKSEPVKGFVGTNSDDELWFCNLNFIEVD
ncbi:MULTISPECIES: hypothetical protein [unclassified Acinetobacter]|uniref:hypothetical protein n=1 Tax=unclassified Acinetobacter TaxID=196816 RepID=UPI0015D3AD93|nr:MULTISPECIES: hypothetical protein [unclassified Acinetobacter]